MLFLRSSATQVQEIENVFKSCTQTTSVVLLKGEDYLQKQMKEEIQGANVYKGHKVSYPCIEGLRRKRTLLMTTVVVKLSAERYGRRDGERLAIRVYSEGNSCKLVFGKLACDEADPPAVEGNNCEVEFGKLTCTEPERDWVLGKDAPVSGKKLGKFGKELAHVDVEVKKWNTRTTRKKCDETFNNIALDLIANW